MASSTPLRPTAREYDAHEGSSVKHPLVGHDTDSAKLGSGTSDATYSLQVGTPNNSQTGSANIQIGEQMTQSGNRNAQIGHACTQEGTWNIQCSDLSTQAGNTNAQFGDYSTQDGQCNLQCGKYLTQSGDYGFASGYSNDDNGKDYTVLSGRDAKASLDYQRILGAKRFADDGDAQISTIPVRDDTNDATPQFLGIGGSGRLIIPEDTVWEFDIHIVAAEEGVTNVKKFHRTGVIVNATGNVSISTVDTIGTDREIGSPGAWTVEIRADTTNDALEIWITGEAAKNIRWVGVVNVVEVSYPGAAPPP